MSYVLGQIDPTPPPMRPVSWPMILGWTAVVGVTLAVFNGTINLGGGRVRANRRTSRRRSSRRNTGRRSSRSATLGWTDPLGFPGYAHQADNARSLGVRPLTKAEYKAEVIRLRGRRHWDTGVVDQLARRHREHTGKKLGENAGRRSSHARPKSPKFSEMAIWESVARVRESGRPSEVAGVLPPGVATKFKHLAPGLYKYGYGPKKGEVIVQFKNASLKGALTSTRIGAKAVGEFHWVVDNFDPKFPVVIRGIDDHGATYWRVEEYAKQHARVPVLVKRKAASR
jgi:hypothetical protein